MSSLLTGLLVTVLASTVCEQDGLKGAKAPGPVPVDEFNDRPPSKPHRGGEITQAVSVGFRSLDGDQDNSALTSEVVENYIMESLIDSDVESWQDVPGLAERWDIEDNVELKDGTVIRGKVTETGDDYEIRDLEGKDVRKVGKAEVKDVRLGTSFTFHLRRGVKFHNGQPFTAKDVEFTYRLLSHPKNGMPNIQGYFAKINECTVIDDFTVRLTYSEQYWMALSVVGGYMNIRPHQAWDPEGLLGRDPEAYFRKFQEHPLMLNPIGTGHYQLESYKKDFEVVLKRYDGYWNKNTPQYPDRIRFRIIKDPVAQLQALKNGEVDYVTSLPSENWLTFFKDAGNRKNFGQVQMVYPAYAWFGFNLRRNLWKDPKVRWAMAYGAADIDKYIREHLNGLAERVTGTVYRYSPNYNHDLKPIPYNPEKAEELLAEAGWFDSDGDGILDKDGQKFEFEVLTRTLPPTVPLMQYILQMQANLKKLGIKMELRMLEWSAFLEKIDRGDFDVCRLAWALSSPPDKSDPFQIWHSSSIGEQGSNHIAYANPKIDDLIIRMRRELDSGKRKELLLEFQKILYDEQPYTWLYMPAELRAYNKKWRGVRFWVPRPGHSLNEWYLEE